MNILPQYDRVGRYTLMILTLVLVGVLAGGLYQYMFLHEKQLQTRQTLENTQKKLFEATTTIARLEQKLSDTQNEKADLRDRLEAEKDRVDELEEQVDDISDTISTVEKRQNLDEELLMKYSRTYFLNEHYRPSELDPIPQEYRYPDTEFEQFHEKAMPFLTEMIEDAEDDGVDLLVASGFRSFDTQKSVHDQYQRVYGDGANQFSAVQGYSEHQLGTTADFTTPELDGSLQRFENTEAYEWLQDNAYKYGFILSYPEGNSYYQFEPWHWRFVGEDLADELHEREIDFYDMPQREIDEYLVNIFED